MYPRRREASRVRCCLSPVLSPVDADYADADKVDEEERRRVAEMSPKCRRNATSNYSGMLVLRARIRSPRACLLPQRGSRFFLFFLFFFFLRCARGVNDMCRERIPNGTPRASHFFSRCVPVRHPRAAHSSARCCTRAPPRGFAPVHAHPVNNREFGWLLGLLSAKVPS